MNVDFAKSFDKQFEKLPRKSQERARAVLDLFIQDVVNPRLRNHSLKGEWLGHCSISAGGDLRLHFKWINDNTVLFVAVGSHAQLYR